MGREQVAKVDSQWCTPTFQAARSRWALRRRPAAGEAMLFPRARGADPLDADGFSPAEQKAFAAERRIAIVRAAVIAFNVAAYYVLLPPGTGIPALAAVISFVASAYAAFVLAAQPYRWWPVMRAALFTALTDGVLIVLWVAASGGFSSPFHLLWLLSMMAVAFRYDSKATLVATVLYVASYLLLLLWEGTLADNAVEVLVRCTYIALAGLLGALLAHDSARAFEARAEEEMQRLRELDRFKTQFINSAAHELNTPLTPLRLQLHLLQRLGRDGDPVARARAVDIVSRNVERLALLVQDMLDVARLQSGRLQLRRTTVDVAVLVRDAIDTYRAPAEAKRIELVPDGPAALPARLDGPRVSQVLYNLVSNAVKYSHDGGSVRIRYSGDEQQVTVQVEDRGPGFTAAQKARMFLPFSQVHTDTHTVPGTGLGLFISRGIAERHGGTLDAVSAGPGQGATFTCVLPGETQPSNATSQ